MVCLLVALQVQLSVGRCPGWPQYSDGHENHLSVLRVYSTADHEWLSVSFAVASDQTFVLTFCYMLKKSAVCVIVVVGTSVLMKYWALQPCCRSTVQSSIVPKTRSFTLTLRGRTSLFPAATISCCSMSTTRLIPACYQLRSSLCCI